MDEILAYPDNDYRSYLEHHGIPGQKWGVRKAAWYPISAFQKASNKIGTKVHEFREKRAAEKKRKQRAANLQKARDVRAQKAKEEKDFAEEKKRILTSGTPGEVIKISNRLSNQEIQDALNRNRNLEQLRAAEKTRIKDIQDAEFNAKYEKFDKIAKTVGKATEYANVAKNALDAYNNVMKFFKDDTPATSDIDAILKNPKNYTDEQVKNAAIRDRNLKSMGYGQNKDEGSTKPASDKSESSKPQTESKPKEETYKQTVEPKPKAEKADNNQRGEFKSKVVDGEWSEIVTPKNVSTALTVVNKAMDSYDSVRSSKTVQNGMKLLEQKNYANLILEPGADDKRRK